MSDPRQESWRPPPRFVRTDSGWRDAASFGDLGFDYYRDTILRPGTVLVLDHEAECYVVNHFERLVSEISLTIYGPYGPRSMPRVGLGGWYEMTHNARQVLPGCETREQAYGNERVAVHPHPQLG